MRILAIERDPTPLNASLPADLLRREAEEVWALQKQGIIRDIWFTTQGRNAVVMLECLNATEARRHLATLPLVRAGMIDFAVFELCTYDGYDRLFTAEPKSPAPRPRSRRNIDRGHAAPAAVPVAPPVRPLPAPPKRTCNSLPGTVF